MVGLFGGYLSGSALLGVNPAFYFSRAQSSVRDGRHHRRVHQVRWSSPSVVVTICCYQGYYTHTRAEFGAKGVSLSTTSAVVISCVLSPGDRLRADLLPAVTGRAMDESPLIELEGVVKTFGDNRVLDGIDLSIHRGEITAIIGKSGSGKSVLLKHIIGLIEPDAGTIRFEGKSRSDDEPGRAQKALKRKFSYVFQDTALFDFLTVFDNVALPLGSARASLGRRSSGGCATSSSSSTCTTSTRNTPPSSPAA